LNAVVIKGGFSHHLSELPLDYITTCLKVRPVTSTQHSRSVAGIWDDVQSHADYQTAVARYASPLRRLLGTRQNQHLRNVGTNLLHANFQNSCGSCYGTLSRLVTNDDPDVSLTHSNRPFYVADHCAMSFCVPK
jgi:hypothetical protein